MELEKFIENLTEVFEDAKPETIKPDAKFKDLEGYSYLVALSLIAMVDEAYHVKIKGDDIRNAVTVEDLFNNVKSKQ